MERHLQQQETSLIETKNRIKINLMESELEDAWKLIKENSPSLPKRRRLEDDAVSSISSRTDSPVSVDSFMDESFCATPTDNSPSRPPTLLDFRKHYKKDELWAAIESNYQYLMDDEIIETCRSTESDLSLDDEDVAANPNVSFNEFMQQYRELTEWLSQIQVFTQRKVMSRSEKYLNQTYHEELLQRSPRHKLLNDYARQLLRRYPALKSDITMRLQHLNTQWQKIEEAISPSKGIQDWKTMLKDLQEDFDYLLKWLQGVENRLLPLCIRNSWSVTEIEEKLIDNQILQKDIESHSRVVSAVLKLSECLQNGVSSEKTKDENIVIPESLQKTSYSLEKRWHAIWLQSLEWQCRLEQAIHSKNKAAIPSDLSAFSPTKFWSQGHPPSDSLFASLHNESSDEHVHDVGGSSLSDPGEETDKCSQIISDTSEKIMPGKPGGEEYPPLGNFRDKLAASDTPDNKSDYVCSMNTDNLRWERTPQLYQESTTKPDVKNEIVNNIVSNSPVHAYKFFQIKNPSKVGNSSNQHFYQMVTLDTDWSTDSTHDDNIPKIINGSLNQTTDSGVIADISNNNIQTQSNNLEEALIETIQSNQTSCSPVEQSSGKELSTASDSGTERSPDMSLETTASESSTSQKSKKTRRSLKSVLSSSSSWSCADQDDAVESSCDASGEESCDSDGSDEFSTATEDSQDDLFDSVVHLNEYTKNMAQLSQSFLAPPTRDNNNKKSKERPWSVIELYEQSNGLDLKPFFISDSALDRLCHQDLTAMPELTPNRNSCPPNFTSATFPRLKGKDKIIRAFHSTTDDVPLHPGVKRKLQNDFSALDLCQMLGTLARGRRTMQTSYSESESDTKELTRQLQNTTVCSGMSDTESDSGGAYGTAMEDTSDGEDIVGSAGSFSEAAWDNYQAPLYPTVSDEATEPALQWSDEMEFDEELPAPANSTIITQMVAKKSDEDSGKGSRSALCDDSDSDLEDFYHVLDESSNQLKVTDHALQKKKKDTGLYLNTGRYTELLATCQTNIKCLEVIYQHLNTATPVSKEDLTRMQALLYQWEKLRALAVERQGQCRELVSVNDMLTAIYGWLQEFSALIKKDQFKGLLDAQEVIKAIQEKQGLFEEKMSKLNELKDVVNSFKEQHPTITVDGYLMKIGKAITELNSLHEKCLLKLPQLQKHLLAWYEYMETKKELDYMLKQQRQQLDGIRHQLEGDFSKNKPNIQNDLKVVQKNVSLCQGKLDRLHSCRLQLSCYLDRAANAAIASDCSENRRLLFAIKQQCQKCFTKAARLSVNGSMKPFIGEIRLQTSSGKPLGKIPPFLNGTVRTADKATDVGNLKSDNLLSPTGATAATPNNFQNTWQGLALVCLAGFAYLVDPEAIEKLADFSISLHPDLQYVNGPPPI